MEWLRLSPDEWTAVRLSLRVSTWATLVSLPFGILVAWLLARRDFPGKAIVNGLVHLPLILPPVVTGYILLLTMGRRRFGAEERHERLGVRALCLGGHRSGVDDRGVAVLRENADDLHRRVGVSVGFVDDAERRLAGRHQREGGADVLGLRHVSRDRVPDAERGQRLLAVPAGRHRVDLTDRQAAVAERAK